MKDQTQTRPEESESKTHKVKPKFGPTPDFDSSSYNFKEDLSRLPFPVNMGDVEMSFEQQKWFLNLVYDHRHISIRQQKPAPELEKLKGIQVNSYNPMTQL